MSIVFAFIVFTGLVVFQATKGGSSIVLSPRELLERAGAADLKRVRVGGRVSSGDISYDITPSFKLEFVLEDRDNPDSKLKVLYGGMRPEMFEVGRDVLIDGDFRAGVLHAQSLLTQCPSKYEAPSAVRKGAD